MSAKALLLATSLLAAAVASASPTFAQAERDGKISFFMFAGSGSDVVPKEVIADYLKKNPKAGIDIVETTNAIIYPKMVTARRTTPDQPLVHCGFFNADTINRGDADDMWEPLNKANIPNMANTLESYARPDARGVPYQAMGIGLLYNTRVMKEPPTSWSVLWSPDSRGKIVTFDNDLRLIGLVSKLNGADEKNPDTGFKLLSENAKNFRALVDSNDALKNLVIRGDAPIAPWFSSVSDVWIKEGSPVGFAVPKEGAIAFPIYMAIAKGVTPAQRAVCEDLLNELLTPDRAGRYALVTSSVPLVTNATLSKEQVENPILNPAIAKNAIQIDFAYIATVAADWRDRWAREIKLKMR
ncbi:MULTISPECIES: extracellular solute-binding protein [unclassified Chelatococcus]|uniref:ABC transporter substrate-binding protein n=1 Tax=unclassified Chelatococcus TaxID=2638111 RepID=UPI0020C00F6A|nr:MULTISPECIES: extracellular solute-binding protein [unclassified Chelatococcus]